MIEQESEAAINRTPEEIEAKHQELQVLMPRMTHSTRVFTYHFRPGGTCSKEGCESPAVMRGWFNCWGTVHEVDLCIWHQDRSGIAGDSL